MRLVLSPGHFAFFSQIVLRSPLSSQRKKSNVREVTAVNGSAHVQKIGRQNIAQFLKNPKEAKIGLEFQKREKRAN